MRKLQEILSACSTRNCPRRKASEQCSFPEMKRRRGSYEERINEKHNSRRKTYGELVPPPPILFTWEFPENIF